MRPKTRHQSVELIHTKTAPIHHLFCSHLHTHTSHTNMPKTHPKCTRWSKGLNTTTHTLPVTHAQVHVHKLLWGMLLENWKLVNHWESLLEWWHCQVLDRKTRLNACYIWSAARETAITSQAVRTTQRWTSFPQTPTTAHESLTGKPVNLKSCSVRFGYIHLPVQRHRFKAWINKSGWVQ